MKRKTYIPKNLSPTILDKSLSTGIYFRVDYFYDPYGDEKSNPKLLKREYYFSLKTYRQIINRFHSSKYYGSRITFSKQPYKNAKPF